MSETIHRPTIDEGYGKTPEEALGAVLFHHPMFDPNEAEYVSDRPEFMSTAVEDVSQYDWEAYTSLNSSEEVTDTPSVSIEGRQITDGENRVVVSINNVLLRLQDADGQSVRGTFECGIMLDEAKWNRHDLVYGTVDKTWRCVLIGSELY